MYKNTVRVAVKFLFAGFLCLIIAFLTTINVAAASPNTSFENPPLSDPFIRDIARATTVFIGLNLEKKEDFERHDITKDSGSGVIIYQQPLEEGLGKDKLYNYFVLTAAHVVKDKGQYGIRLYNGDIIQFNDTQSTDDLLPGGEPTTDEEEPSNITSNASADSRVRTIYRFGKLTEFDQATRTFKIQGTDLALIRFTSDKDYPVAAIGKFENDKDEVKVAGWPQAVTSNKRSLFIIDGNIKGAITPDIMDGSYTLEYTSRTNIGGSGGPVFNNRGEVIAIHGKGSTDTRFSSLGIEISQLIELQKKDEGYSTAFDPPIPLLTLPTPVDPQALKDGKANVYLAMNMSEQEYKENFGVLDVVDTDPAYEAILTLNKKYGGSCMQPYDDGNFRPGIYQRRGQVAGDLYGCLNTLQESISSKFSKYTTTKEQVNNLRKGIEDLTKEVAAIRQTTNTSLGTNQKIFCDLSGPTPRTYIRTGNSETKVMIEWVSKFFSSSNYDPATRCKQVSSRLQEYYKAGNLNYITSSQIGHQTVLCAALEKKDAELGQCTGGLIFTLEPKDDPKVMIQEFKNALNSEHTLIKHNSKPLLRYIDMREILAQ